MIVGQAEDDEPGERRPAHQVRRQADHPQAHQLKPVRLSCEDGIERQEELFGEQLGMSEFERQQTDAEGHAGEDIRPCGLFDEDHRQDPQADVDSTEETGDDEFGQLPIETRGSLGDGCRRLLDETVFEVEIVLAETFALFLLGHGPSLRSAHAALSD